jgi:hypothetical protein
MHKSESSLLRASRVPLNLYGWRICHLVLLARTVIILVLHVLYSYASGYIDCTVSVLKLALVVVTYECRAVQ